ncbi:Haloacid dehalogenase [Apiospora phragmitis]|uniref:Haloacid dehalogenase n=1 Tax=Apiospora phragmitis TaxID=2905665 RepID=A0ABR1V3J6_9PEZI
MATTLKLSNYRLLCFDVYGTLVDWETGILTALKPLLEANDAAAKFSNEHLLTVYHELEAAQQAETPSMPYSQLLATVHPQIAARLNLARAPSPKESEAFGQSVGSWPAFPDTVEALRRLQKHYKLVVLSNVDRESFAATNAGPLAGVPFDLVITAQDVGTYKPDPGNFEHMLRRVEAEFGVTPDQVIQTAQSQFHDHHPAKKVGLRSSWIVRPGAIMGNRGEELYDWKFDTLGEMADALEKEQ